MRKSFFRFSLAFWACGLMVASNVSTNAKNLDTQAAVSAAQDNPARPRSKADRYPGHGGHWDSSQSNYHAARKIRRAHRSIQNMMFNREIRFRHNHENRRRFKELLSRVERSASMLRNGGGHNGGGHYDNWDHDSWNDGHCDDDQLYPGNERSPRRAKRMLERTLDHIRDMRRDHKFTFDDDYARSNFRENMRSLRAAKEMIKVHPGGGHPGDDHWSGNYRREAERILRANLGYNAESAMYAMLPQRLNRGDVDFIRGVATPQNQYYTASNMRAYFTNHRASSDYSNMKGQAGIEILYAITDWNRDQCLATLPAHVSSNQLEEVRRILRREPSYYAARALSSYFRSTGSHNGPSWPHRQAKR